MVTTVVLEAEGYESTACVDTMYSFVRVKLDGSGSSWHHESWRPPVCVASGDVFRFVFLIADGERLVA